jgi:hypothetical protein
MQLRSKLPNKQFLQHPEPGLFPNDLSPWSYTSNHRQTVVAASLANCTSMTALPTTDPPYSTGYNSRLEPPLVVANHSISTTMIFKDGKTRAEAATPYAVESASTSGRAVHKLRSAAPGHIETRRRELCGAE